MNRCLRLCCSRLGCTVHADSCTTRLFGMKAWDALNRRVVSCERCPRLREYCREIARAKKRAYAHWEYWGRPVPNFGSAQAQLLVVGLAPAAHGGNRTGRIFTGDRSGDWLYRALHKAGFANQPTSVARDDSLALIDCAITAVAHCAPPDNKPLPQEIANCRQWLIETIDTVAPRILVALGQIAWRALIVESRRREWLGGSPVKFSHGASQPLAGDRWLLASYHPSQQNTFTGKLTEPMFDGVFAEARRLVGANLPGGAAEGRTRAAPKQGRSM
jgi:uracil-DNA glycosylase